MDKNNSSNNQQYSGKDANGNAKRNYNVHNEGNENPAAKHNNTGHNNPGKGTGMSNEANSKQKEEAWQGTGGSTVNEAQRKNMNDSSQTTKNHSGTQNLGTVDKMNNGNNNSSNNNSNLESGEKAGMAHSHNKNDNKK